MTKLTSQELIKSLKNSTPEARFKRHEKWILENQDRLLPNVLELLEEIGELLKQTEDMVPKSRLILGLLKALDNFKQFFDHYPLAVDGAKFKVGRKDGSVGPIRKFIRGKLQQSPSLTNHALWVTMSKRPPKGWEMFDNRSGKYLMGPARANGDIQNVDYRRFCNIAASERKLLKY